MDNKNSFKGKERMSPDKLFQSSTVRGKKLNLNVLVRKNITRDVGKPTA